MQPAFSRNGWMHLLVCGGAGYVGSHVAKVLHARGHHVTVLDNLSTGHREAVRWGQLIRADLLDAPSLEAAFQGQHYDAVLHFCARSLVGESMSAPYDYYENNVVGTLNLLRVMRRHAVDRIVFSSTAAVFGDPVSALIDEEHPKAPINPYGASKLMVERILADAAQAYGLHSVCLRYFNAAGASAADGIGESHEPETHLIPNLLRALINPAAPLKVFGQDYPTPDGTCVRDYVHVLDLADAHVRALDHMTDVPGAQAFNLGNGTGFSVMQVIRAAEQVTGLPVPFEAAPRRARDPPVLVAASQRAREVLGWAPTYTDIEAVLRSAWDWHRTPAF
ncbi:UDP-glucose 4-epimerase GalE [Pseudoxanthomonas sp. SL93]|uniref:UDP-glucose 4-epimerase GalE n=1 Tax=Pseudoxanthomonas sp. SL93 TaxID=2995142 RepID=UPI00226EBE33|nr:UDP-glucose 4-epimerase GalE [Pseudoxanthomonas sp. SL93]WAC61619.1 UDP-glucose 4-epimerase GalE [Pseudoxanthomonas sp. SL93]